ncbi:MAG: cytochrome B [Phyllobacteriaceae bacterium]|nr:cytochrome B [Phyllobacteriaceae bacterium]MBA89395.1 cytochrome B [Phyllobacteriaceae bacterium]
MTPPARYHPLLVALHWLMAAMIIVALVMGGAVLAETPNSDPGKIDALRGHMIFGLLLLVLVLLRLAVRLRTRKLPHATTGNPLLDRIGVWTHRAFYALVILVAASGIGISALAGLPGIVFLGNGEPLPADFWAYAPRYGHAVLTKLLGILILAHLAAAMWHQFVRKDRLMARMWFGKS